MNLKEKLNNWEYKTYIAKRKKDYPTIIPKEFLQQIPDMANVSVFGKNKMTNWFQKVTTGYSSMPTHSCILDRPKQNESAYLHEINNRIAEADLYYSYNTIQRYADDRLVFHWFKNLTEEEEKELRYRIQYLVDKKLKYDVLGYAGFVTSIIPGLNKLLHASEKTVFCSDANALVYGGGKKNSYYDEVKKWEEIKQITLKPDSDQTTPADIYLYLNNWYDLMPSIMGRAEWIPQKG